MTKSELPATRQVSCGVIVCIKIGSAVKILLLEQNNAHYGRAKKRKIMDIGPSGRVEAGESIIETARRELKQETNLDLEIEKDFKDSYSYAFDAIAYEGKFKGSKTKIIKTRKYFLAYASEQQLKKLKLSDEHVAYKFVTIEEALSLKSLMKPQKELLKRLRSRLSIQEHLN